MKRLNYCIFKDIDSRELGLFMEHCPEKISPKRRDETFTVPGRHGNLTTTDGAFDTYIRSAEFIVKDENRIDEICAHFKGSGWLIFSSEPDRKYKARVANQIEFSHVIRHFKRFAVEFVPLQDTEEYKDFSVLEKVYIGDTVQIFHEDLKIELSTKVIGYKFDALSQRYKKVILGNVNPKYGDTQRQYVKQQKEETTTALEQAIINATQLITGNSGGYVVLHPSEKPQEIFIMDTPDMNSAQRVWRWNLSGLGYSSTGINGSFELAMTMDGAIVADFITAGTINGALIKACSVEAESLSQEYTKSVTDAINDVEINVTQAFQAADGQLSSTISETYLTKNSASSTYATKTALIQTASEISTEVSKKVDNSEFATKITQNAYSVRVAWNNNSNYIQLEAGQLAIYNGSVSTNQRRAVFDENGNHFYRDGYYVGKIGTNQLSSDTAKKGLTFDLEYQGAYMSWAARTSSSASTYTTKWTYVQTGKSWSNYTANTLHAGCDVDMHYYTLKNVNFEGGGITGTLNMVQPLEMNSDGTLQRWSNGCKLQFQNGILVSGTWYG